MREAIVQHALESRERASLGVLLEKARRSEVDLEDLLRSAYWMGARNFAKALKTPVH